jgi:hypothetical protein
MSLITAHLSATATTESSTIQGPREDDLTINYYSNVYTAYRALEAGDIDMVNMWLPDSWEPPPWEPHDPPLWIASFGSDGIANEHLDGRYVGTDDPYNGYGVPNWTGPFTIAGGADVASITVHALPLTADEYTYNLTEGVDYLVSATDTIDLLTPLDVPIINEHWTDGVNNTLHGWPWIDYVASGIQSVYVKFPNGTERLARNDGYQMPPPSEWWYEPDWPWELEGWWALGYFQGLWTWPAGSEWWINYTAASYVTINYAPRDLPPRVNPFRDAISNPDIVTCQIPDSGFYEFDLNNNYSIAEYPGIRSPMNYTAMRQAIAFLSNKDYYVNTLLAGKAVRIDQMIAARYYGWANASMSYPYYPYEYSPAAAKTKLDSTFPVGTTPNLYYNVSNPLSSPCLRQYPADHPQKAGQDLDPLIFYVRTWPDPLVMVGRSVYYALREMGVPVDARELWHIPPWFPWTGDFNYHIWTGAWHVGQLPATTLYGLYHSVNAYPYGSNYVTGGRFPFVGDNATDPRLYRTHPYLDELLYRANYATTYEDAVTYCKMAAGYMTEICVNVPLWSNAGYWGWSKNLLGVVNKQGGYPENDYTFLNAYKVDGSAIRCGTISYPSYINIVYSSWVYDYSNLDRINLYGGIDTPAYNVAANQVGFVDYFDTTTWDDGGENKTKLVQSYREDAYTAKPVSGDQGEHINASHYFWNAWLDYQIGDGWYSDDFADLHHIEITGPYDCEIYLDTLSYWNTYYCQGPLRPMDLWMAQGDTFIADYTETVTTPAMPGVIPLTYDPIWFTSVTADGTPLTFMTDYNIILGDLYILTPQAGDLVVTYWYVPDNALRGFTPGDLPWQTILEGAGMYYITSYSTSTATFKRNPHYWLETPPLGEIDFVMKPSGEYAVDWFDMALMSSAYGTQGTSVPDPGWLPGADLFPPGGVIDDFDVAVLVNALGDGNPEHEVTLISSIPLQTEVTSGEVLGINVTLRNDGIHNETIPVRIHANCTEAVVDSIDLAAGATATVTVFWNTSTFAGRYLISTFIGPVDAIARDYECNLWNNVLLDASEVMVHPVEHTIVVEAAGQKYNLTVETDSTLTHIIATKNLLHFDVTGQAGCTAHLNVCIPAGLNTTAIAVFINNVKLTYPPFPFISTNGTHYFIYVETALSTRTVDIQYAAPDVTVTNAASKKTAIGAGYPTTIEATVQNLVAEARTVNVAVYADLNPITLGDEIVIAVHSITLGALESRPLSTGWSTAGLDKGTYIITMTADNIVVLSPVIVTIPGDTDGDRKVDIFDIVRMAGGYGIPPPLYDPNGDIDGDSDIDIFDLVIAAGNYGTSW